MFSTNGTSPFEDFIVNPLFMHLPQYYHDFFSGWTKVKVFPYSKTLFRYDHCFTTENKELLKSLVVIFIKLRFYLIKNYFSEFQMKPDSRQLKTSGSLLEQSIRKPCPLFIEKLKRSNKLLLTENRLSQLQYWIDRTKHGLSLNHTCLTPTPTPQTRLDVCIQNFPEFQLCKGWGERELQDTFQRLHCFVRTARNYTK